MTNYFAQKRDVWGLSFHGLAWLAGAPWVLKLEVLEVISDQLPFMSTFSVSCILISLNAHIVYCNNDRFENKDSETYGPQGLH